MAHIQQDISKDAVTVRMPRDLVEHVRTLALAHERSLSAELRVALTTYIKQQKGGK